LPSPPWVFALKEQELGCGDPVRGLVFFQIPEDKKPKVFVNFTQRAFQNAQIVKWTI
jgi:hypothetical protein